MKSVDLDTEKDCVIFVSYAGERRAVTKADLLRLLETERRYWNQGPGPGHGYEAREEYGKKQRRSLASLGRLVANIAKASGEPPSEHDQRRLVAGLRAFDEDTSGTRTTQVGHRLRALLAGNLTEETRAEIEAFLARFPEVEMVPRKR